MKHGIKILTLSLLIIAGFAQAQEMKVKMVAYTDCHPDLNQLDFSSKPQQCSMSSQSITFMVEGYNIALIDKDSLKFSKLEVGGKDVRYNRKGDNAFELGSFPKVDENGEFAIFDINLKSAPFGHIGSASIDGTLDIITSERLINEEKNNLSLKEGFSIKVGPLTVSNQQLPRQKPEGALSKAGEALTQELKTSFFGGSRDSLSIYVRGDLDALVSLEVFENGQKLTPGWTMTSDNENEMTFSKPTGSVIDFKLKYWDGLKSVTVPINL